MNRLRQFLHYLKKVFDLAGAIASLPDPRPWPQIPLEALCWSLLLGQWMRIKGLEPLEQQTGRRRWQKLVGWNHPISDDAFDYLSERLDAESLRRMLVNNNKTLKANKAFDRNKIRGMLVASVDANEQFCSTSRCCSRCSQRRVQRKDAAGIGYEETQYYHRQVYCQLLGRLSVILDVEPVEPGEDEVGAALRLLKRVRENYGPRFFDIVVADAAYAEEPFLTTVSQWGWEWVVVLKQQKYEVYKEVLALTEGKQATMQIQPEGREVGLWEVKDLQFSSLPVWAVRSQEKITRVRQRGGQRQKETGQQHWIWMASKGLEPNGAKLVWAVGHSRWRIENNAFNELTQYWHLEHCDHHQENAVMVLLLFKVLAFNLTKAYGLLSQLARQGKVTLVQLRRELYLGLEEGEPVVLRSG
jgi:hypothetical protein